MVFMAALLLSAASCKKETKEETEYEGGFTAKAEAQQNDSKVYLVGTGLEWNATESIMVFNRDGKGQKFTSYKVYINEANFKPDFEGGEEPDDFDETFYKEGGYTAYYPYDKMTNNGGTVSFAMPATQTYTVCDNHVTFDRDAFPMAGKTETTAADDRFIYFKNICGLLELSLYTKADNCNVQTITLTSNDENEHLSGFGPVTFTGDVPTIALDGGNVLTLDCSDYNNHQGVTLSTSESSPTVFYFVVPAGTLGSGFSVEVETDHGNFKKTAPANEIELNKMKQMPKLEVKASSVPKGALSGKFSIGTNSKGEEIQVYFSKGNLQFHTSDKVWRFAEDQWEVCDVNPITHQNSDYADNTNKWIDLFGWGTSNYDYGATCYQPWSISPTTTDYGPLSGDLTVAGNSDWGANTISNAVGTGWRTLSSDEWNYLLNVRKIRTSTGKEDGSSGKGHTYQWVSYNDKTGFIIYPNVYDGTKYAQGVNIASDAFPDGCLFLPAGGFRRNPIDPNYSMNADYIYIVWTAGDYWTSSRDHYFGFTATSTDVYSLGGDHSWGMSVRLVRLVETD